MKNFWPKIAKTWNRKFFRTKFFPGTLSFFGKKNKIEKKCQSQKFLVDFFWSKVIQSECFKTYFKLKISKSKNFSAYFFPGAQLFFYQNSVLIHRNRRSFQFRARLPNYRLQPSSECIFSTSCHKTSGECIIA